MISRLRAIIARKSISGSGTITPSARASRTSWAASLVARSVLLGMQPRKMHSPPSGPGSTNAPSAPRRTRRTPRRRRSDHSRSCRSRHPPKGPPTTSSPSVAQPKWFRPQTMDTFDEPNGSSPRMDADRVRLRLISEEAHAMDEIAVGDPRRDEDDVVAPDQIVHGQHAVDLADPHRSCALGFGFVAGLEAAHETTPQTLERRSRQHAFRGPPDPHRDVDPRPLDGGRDRRVDVAVGDELDPSPGAANLGDQVLVPRPVEDHDGYVVDRSLEGVGDGLEVVLDRSIQVDERRGFRPDRQLAHIGIRGMKETASLGDRHHGDRVGETVGDQIRPLDGVDGDVDLDPSATEPLADVEHRGFVAFTFTDDDPARDLHIVERFAHLLDGGSVGDIALTAPHPTRGGQRRRLSDFYEIERIDGSLLRAPRDRRRHDTRSLAYRTDQLACCTGP